MDCPSTPPPAPDSAQYRLLNRHYILNYLTKEAPWHKGHGASSGFLGSGILYYSFVYMLRAQVAVCLGSGGGFVPRIIRQAQRDMRLQGSRTILVDANRPEAGWGQPRWLAEDSFFRTQFPDVQILLATTAHAYERFFVPEGLRINYLHIDADHSYEECLADFDRYRNIMAERFVISIHDTDMPTVNRVVEELRKRDDLELVNFPDVGRGLAIVRSRLAADTSKLYWAEDPSL